VKKVWYRVISIITDLRLANVPEIKVHGLKSKEKMSGIDRPRVPPIAAGVVEAGFAAAMVQVGSFSMKAQETWDRGHEKNLKEEKNPWVTKRFSTIWWNRASSELR